MLKTKEITFVPLNMNFNASICIIERDGWIFSKFFFIFAILWTSNSRPASTHLNRTSVVNKGCNIRPKQKLFLREKASNPEWIRQTNMHAQAANRHSVGLHFARSQSQPHNKRTLKITWVPPWSNGKRKINTNLACKTLEGENTCVH